MGDAKVVANTVAGPELNDIEKSTVALGNALDGLVDAVVGDLDVCFIFSFVAIVRDRSAGSYLGYVSLLDSRI